jgi:ATP-binding cassette subfamily B protein IrtA
MTAVQPALDEVEPSTSKPEPRDAAKRAATYDALALKQLLAPTRARSSRAQRYQLLASTATVVPFIGIVELGRALLADGPVNTTRAWTIVAVVIIALLVRTLAGGAALTITHFADVDLQRSLRLRIVEKLGRLPLGWFSATSSGEVRKAVQNDVGELHFLVAHSAVENTGALATPVFGLAYCFYLDWRLGLLALATVPVYIAILSWLGRDSRVAMDRLNQGVERISATIVEFIVRVCGQDVRRGG